MRVVHVHRVAGVGGSERHLLTLLPALRAHGIDPAFVGLDLPGPATERFYSELRRLDVDFARLACAHDLSARLAPRIARAAGGLGAEALHTHLVHADVYGAAAAVMARVPLFATKHNDDPFRAGVFRHVERLTCRRARAIVAITDALRRFLVQRVGLPGQKLVTIRYGLDELPAPLGESPRLDLPEGAPMLLAVARLTPQKGLETAVRALPALLARHPAARLVVAGDGPARETLRRLAVDLGVSDALVLLGQVGDVAALYRRADVFVHPARWEGFGLVLLEAMLAGLPVVATRVSSIPEICVDGVTGSLVPRDDPAALGAAIDAILADDAVRLRMGAAGRERAKTEFSVARMAGETAALYAR